MITIIGVRFRCAGKIYYFDPGELVLSRGDQVLVETARGTELGTVVVPNKDVEEEQVVLPLKPVLRVATEEDLETVKKNKEKEKAAFFICKEKIKKHGLEMKLVDVEYTFDNNKILFYFTADGRIDFRELVKDLASVFKTRIELRQIGVRDETKIKGGIGICGRCLCCSCYLSEFAPVSIKMAKEQNLSLNPSKISGVCGRLMCCLKNEQETYEYLNSRMPSVGDYVYHKGDDAQGKVQTVNVLRQTVRVLVNLDGDTVEAREFPVEEVDYQPHPKKEKGNRGEEPKETAAAAAAAGSAVTSEGEAPAESADRESGETKDPGEGRENRENRNRRNRRPRERREGNEGKEGRENESSRRQDSGRRREGSRRSEGGRRSEDGRRQEDSRRPEGSRRKEDGRRPEGSRRREDGRRPEDSRRKEDGRRQEGSRRREDGRRSEGNRRPEDGRRQEGSRRSRRRENPHRRNQNENPTQNQNQDLNPTQSQNQNQNESQSQSAATEQRGGQEKGSES